MTSPLRGLRELSLRASSASYLFEYLAFPRSPQLTMLVDKHSSFRGVDYGIQHKFGKCSVFNVELWGVLDGLALIHKRRYDSSYAIQHFPRDCNKVVDCLATMAFDMNQGMKILDKISREVLALSHMVQASVNTVPRISCS
ncbi:hypothetical protein Godav_009603 [Gossypium davidsonii]|uniref:RNase H type-1 domain-containing protein n=1 Tax=Gossypium davidsonii TaxID=34287 RepID=A0A7J8SDP5_GOSDV|nr:hypothetical protein [Gossypium davidsonii]